MDESPDEVVYGDQGEIKSEDQIFDEKLVENFDQINQHLLKSDRISIKEREALKQCIQDDDKIEEVYERLCGDFHYKPRDLTKKNISKRKGNPLKRKK